MRPRLLLFIIVGLFSLSILAQPAAATCPAIVEQALTQMGRNCSGLERNSACYGFTRVDASFNAQVPDGFFSRPADRASIVDLKTLVTSPLNLDSSQWGVAVMNVQANVPDTLPGQAVTFLLLGDAQVENAVQPNGLVGPPVTAITQADTQLHSGPSADTNLVGNVTAGTVLQLAAANSDKSWVQVSAGGGAAWVTRAAFNPLAPVDKLPVADSSPLNPMQAFYLRTGLNKPECAQTPSVVAIRSPQNIKVDLTANGANIQLGSLILLQILPPGNVMKLTTLEGNAVLDANTPNALSVPAGYSTTLCLDEPDNLGIDGEANDRRVGRNCSWTPIQISDPEEGQTVQAALERLNAPPPVPVPTSQPQVVQCPSGTTLTHVVLSGETLYRIALRYRASMGAIMQANSIANQQLIFAGQRLTIPCGVDTGIPLIPPGVPPQQPGIPPAVVDCSRFRATSPLDGLPYGTATFYWDPAPGATGYVVNLYNLDEKGGGLVGTFQTDGNHTSLRSSVTIDAVGYGFKFAWEVLALYNGQPICTSARASVPREAPPPTCPSTSAC
jgi:LysM repeat protein